MRSALDTIENLQLDPLNVAGRAHDLILQARVLDYRPEMLDQVVYAERRGFDWGNWLAVRPMVELPFYRVNMGLRAKRESNVETAREHRGAIKHVLKELEKRGPLKNRDFDGAAVKDHYRGRKDTAIALYYLWIKGEVMTSSRARFERVYDLAERVAPTKLLEPVSAREHARFHALKLVSFFGLGRIELLNHWLCRNTTPSEIAKLKRDLLKAGELVPVEVKARGWRSETFVRAADLELLMDVAAGKVPKLWKPLEATGRVSFLSPLDHVSARGRARNLFDFDYVWEVYKKVEHRLWGYYVLPILWDDRLIGRLDVRKTRDNLEVLGFWLEDEASAKDPTFVAAFRVAVTDFLAYLAVPNLTTKGPGARLLRKLLGP